jgi:hypothetical protein
MGWPLRINSSWSRSSAGLCEYANVVTIADALAAFGQRSRPGGQGAASLFSAWRQDYSTKSAVGENNAKIVSAHVARTKSTPTPPHPETQHQQLGRITATLERFGYVVTAQFSGADVA